MAQIELPGFADLAPVDGFTDPQILVGLEARVVLARRLDAEMICRLTEVIERRLYAQEGLTNVFMYCRRKLRMSEGAAWRRISIARAGALKPVLLDALLSGKVHLSGLAELSKVVTADNVHEWLDRAEGLSLKRIKALVKATQGIEGRPTKKRATLQPLGIEAPPEPKPDQPSLFDTPPAPPDPTPPKAPEAAHPPAPPAPAPPVPQPPEPGPAPSPRPPEESELRRLVYRLSLLVGEEFCTLLDEAKALLSHAVPDGDVEQVLIRALRRLIAEVKKERFGVGKGNKGKGKKKARKPKLDETTEAARPERSRHIPDAIKSEVHDRDGARCAYVAPDGTACESDRFVQHHHIHPFAKGGAHTSENITHYCHTHNALAARQDYGTEKAEAWRKDRKTK